MATSTTTTTTTTAKPRVRVLGPARDLVESTTRPGLGVTLDTRTGRAVVVDGGGTRRLPDPWNWVPSGVRRWIPFLPPPLMRTQTVPASVSVLATTPQTRP
jgi:hypothetical protein